MCGHTHLHIQRASLITGLTACAWSLNSMAPKRENPSNLALPSALRLHQGRRWRAQAVRVTLKGDHFTTVWLTVTILCLHRSLFFRLPFAKLCEYTSVLRWMEKMTVGESRRFIVLDKDKWLLLNQICDLELACPEWHSHREIGQFSVGP